MDYQIGQLLQIDLGEHGAYVGRLTQLSQESKLPYARLIVTGFLRVSKPRFEGAAVAPSWPMPGQTIQAPLSDFAPAASEGFSYPEILRRLLADYEARLAVDPRDTTVWLCAEMIKQQINNYDAMERYSLNAGPPKPTARRRSKRR